MSGLVFLDFWGKVFQPFHYFVNCIFFAIIKAVSWALDLLTQLFFIFAGMTPVSNGEVNGEGELIGVDLVNFFLNQKQFQSAYGWLCLIALGLVIVFAVSKIIKQDYFDRSGPRSKAPIFRQVVLSFIAFICVIPVFLFIVDIVGALALLVMKAMGYQGGGIGTMLFNMSWEDNGVLFQKLGEIHSDKINDPNNFGWYSDDTYFHYVYDSASGEEWGTQIVINNELWDRPEFYWWMYGLGAFAVATSLFQMIMAMISRLYKLVALFIIAPSPISQIVLDEGAKFKNWAKQVIQESLKVVGCVISLMIFLLIITSVEDLDLMAFAYTDQSASAMDLIGANSVVSELSATNNTYGSFHNDTVDVLNSFGRVLIVMGGAGAIKDIDSVISPLLAGGGSSMDMGASGQAVAGGIGAVAGGAMKLAGAGVGLAVAGAKAGIGKLHEGRAKSLADKKEAADRVAAMEKAATEKKDDKKTTEGGGSEETVKTPSGDGTGGGSGSQQGAGDNNQEVDKTPNSAGEGGGEKPAEVPKENNETESTEKKSGEEKKEETDDKAETPKDGVQAINGPLKKEQKEALTKSMTKKVTAERKAREKNEKLAKGQIRGGKAAAFGRGIKTVAKGLAPIAKTLASTALGVAKGVIASTAANDFTKTAGGAYGKVGGFGGGFKSTEKLRDNASKKRADALKQRVANANAYYGHVKSDDEIAKTGSEKVNATTAKFTTDTQEVEQTTDNNPGGGNPTDGGGSGGGMPARDKEPNNVKMVNKGASNLGGKHGQNVVDASTMVVEGSTGVEASAAEAVEDAAGSGVNVANLTSKMEEEDLQTMMEEYQAAVENEQRISQTNVAPGSVEELQRDKEWNKAVKKREELEVKMNNLSTVDKMKMERVKLKNATVAYETAVANGDTAARNTAQAQMKAAGNNIKKYAATINKSVSTTKKEVKNARKVQGKQTTAATSTTNSANTSLSVGQEVIKRANEAGMGNLAGNIARTVGVQEQTEINKQEEEIQKCDQEISKHDETLATQNEELNTVNSAIEEIDNKLKPFARTQAGGGFVKNKKGQPVLNGKLNKKQKQEAETLLAERAKLVEEQTKVTKGINETQSKKQTAVVNKEKAVTAKQTAQQNLSKAIKDNKGNKKNTAGDNLYIAQTEHQQAVAAYNEAVAGGANHETVVAAQQRMQETGAALNKAQKTYNKEVKNTSKKLGKATGKIPVFKPTNSVATTKQSATNLQQRIKNNLENIDTSNLGNYLNELEVKEAEFNKAETEYREAVDGGKSKSEINKAKKKMEVAHASLKAAKKKTDKSVKSTTKQSGKAQKAREKFVNRVRQKYAPRVDFEIKQKAVQGRPSPTQSQPSKVEQQPVNPAPAANQNPTPVATQPEKIKVVVDLEIPQAGKVDDNLREVTEEFVKVANNSNSIPEGENVNLEQLEEKFSKLSKLDKMTEKIAKDSRLAQVLRAHTNNSKGGRLKQKGTPKKHAKRFHMDSYNSAVNSYNEAMDKATQAMERYKNDQSPETLVAVQEALKDAVKHNTTIRDIEVKIQNDEE